MEMIGHGFAIHFTDPTFLRPNTRGKIAKMINRQRHVGSTGFANGFTVIPVFLPSLKVQGFVPFDRQILNRIAARSCTRGAPIYLSLCAQHPAPDRCLVCPKTPLRTVAAGHRRQVLVILAVGRRYHSPPMFVVAGFNLRGNHTAGLNTC